MKLPRKFLARVICGVVLAAVAAISSPASAQLVVSQIYADETALGPNGDFVEIFNRSCANVNLDGYSVQITFAINNVWAVVRLPSVVLAPGQYYLIKINETAVGIPTTADLTLGVDDFITTLSRTSGKVAIIRGDQPLSILDTNPPPTGGCPASTLIVDFVRYANVSPVACSEGPSKSVSGAAVGTGIARAGAGCTDTNSNNADFAVTAVGPALRRTTSPLNPCAGIVPNFGACNLADGTCQIRTEANCASAGGQYVGNCTACDPSGTCCLANGTCVDVIQSGCSGVFTAGAICSNTIYDITQIPANFINIATSGTILPGIVAGSDSGASPVQLPFPFAFYGVAKTAANVSVNGLISFETPGTGFNINSPIPDVFRPNDSIYAMWNDMNFRDGTQSIRTQTNGVTPNRIFIIQWTDVPQAFNQPGSSNTFQIQLREGSPCIEMHYSTVDAVEIPVDSDGTTVGVENAAGNAATQLAPPSTTECRATLAALVANGQALRLCPGASLVSCPVIVGCTCFGDLNGDTSVDGRDISAFASCVISAGGSGCSCADMDHAGGVSLADVDEFIVSLMSGTCGSP